MGGVARERTRDGWRTRAEAGLGTKSGPATCWVLGGSAIVWELAVICLHLLSHYEIC